MQEIMRACLFIVILAMVALVGCNPYPRYRVGGAETAQKAVVTEGQTTNDNIRLGYIMQNYLGRPYSGRSKYVNGVDCSYFVSDVFQKFNETKIPRTVKEQFKQGKDIPYRHLKFGDLVFYRTERNRISHVGIFVGDNRFIHASTSRGVIITAMNEEYWSKRYAGARRILFPSKK